MVPAADAFEFRRKLYISSEQIRCGNQVANNEKRSLLVKIWGLLNIIYAHECEMQNILESRACNDDITPTQNLIASAIPNDSAKYCHPLWQVWHCVKVHGRNSFVSISAEHSLLLHAIPWDPTSFVSRENFRECNSFFYVGIRFILWRFMAIEILSGSSSPEPADSKIWVIQRGVRDPDAWFVWNDQWNRKIRVIRF